MLTTVFAVAGLFALRIGLPVALMVAASTLLSRLTQRGSGFGGLAK
jgi:hypothetical protein